MEQELGYIVAKGPEGLQSVLSEVLEKTKADTDFKSKAHYILYELGNQKPLIKMDFSEWPVGFWHYDLLGRPATGIVKDILARFAWSNCGEREWYYKEKGAETQANEELAYTEWRAKIFEGKAEQE